MSTKNISLKTTIIAHLSYMCPMCTSPPKAYKTPFNLRRHLESPAHNITLSSRPSRGIYKSVNEEENVVVVGDDVTSDIIYYGCTSCWCIDSDQACMSKHILSSHVIHQPKSVGIATKSDVYHFKPSGLSRAPKRVKIAVDTIFNLASVVTIITDTSISDQTNLVSIKKYKNAFQLISGALGLGLEDLPRFLWNFEPKSSHKDDQIMVKIVQCVLTDFYSKSHRDSVFQPEYERTFWVDRVVPIFQAFGDHSNLLGFQWCEVSTEEHIEFIIDPANYVKTAGIKFHDGLGYDKSGRSRLVMEGSSKNNKKEDLDHSKDDAIKLMHTAIELLDSMLRRNICASYKSLSQLKAYSIQCICKTITLTVTSMDPENPGKYINTQVRFADIPVSYSNRAYWAPVFELVAYLFDSLRKQKRVIETVIMENVGIAAVADEERANNILERQ